MKRWPNKTTRYPSEWPGFVLINDDGWFLYEGTSIGKTTDADYGDRPAIGVMMVNAHWFESFDQNWALGIEGCFLADDVQVHPLTPAAHSMLAIAGSHR